MVFHGCVSTGVRDGISAPGTRQEQNKPDHFLIVVQFYRVNTLPFRNRLSDQYPAPEIIGQSFGIDLRYTRDSPWSDMSLAPLLDIIHSQKQDSWSEDNKKAFEALFGSSEGRYPKSAAKAVMLRAPKMSADSVPFAAYIHPSNPPSGAYSGLSFVIFPVPDAPCFVGLVIGTQGLSPDEAILGRPGHARKAQAICSWLNREYGGGSFVAWAKHDPTRTDLSVPDSVKQAWPMYRSVFDKYGKEMYALYRPTPNQAGTEAATTAFLDLLFEERGYQPDCIVPGQL